MTGFFGIAGQYPLIWVIMAALNFILARYIVSKLAYRMNNRVKEALGGRNVNGSFYTRCRTLIRSRLKEYSKKRSKPAFFTKARQKLKKAGYTGAAAPFLYLFIKYVTCPALALVAFVVNFPGLFQAIFIAAAVLIAVEAVLARKKRNMANKLQRHIYKVYKYLHNQISSGVRVQDAIRTVYEVIDDRHIKNILIRLAARFELTLDIEASLAEFEGSFDAHEAETLCIALRQGIQTGDNQELLARQEEVMFKKYFNYIQSETEGCKMRCMVVALMLSTIVVLLIAIPMFNDVGEAIGKIFIN